MSSTPKSVSWYFAKMGSADSVSRTEGTKGNSFPYFIASCAAFLLSVCKSWPCFKLFWSCFEYKFLFAFVATAWWSLKILICGSFVDFELIIFTALKPAWLVWRKKMRTLALGVCWWNYFVFHFYLFFLTNISTGLEGQEIDLLIKLWRGQWLNIYIYSLPKGEI